jgi:hypothetical protein
VRIDAAYFRDYCGHGPYDESYLYYSRVDHCIEIVDRLGIEVRNVLVLGAATGRVLAHFDEAWGIRPHGCELSAWAHARIPARYRRYIERADMRRYVRDRIRSRQTYDLVFTNALVYLPAREIAGFLERCSRISGHLHFWSSTTEDLEPQDRYRVTTRSKRWWRARFTQSGFSPTRSPYVWRSGERGRFG